MSIWTAFTTDSLATSALAETWALDNDENSAAMHGMAGSMDCIVADTAEIPAEGLGDGHVNDNPVSSHGEVIKETGVSLAGSIEQLIGHHNIPGPILWL